MNSGQNSYANMGVYQLMRELQYMLYNIARSAELGDPKLIDEIRKEADIALRLVDSFMFSKRLENSQLELKLSPTGLGALLHETAYEVRRLSDVEVEVRPKALQPVMASNLLLKNILFSIGYFMSKTNQQKLSFCSFKGPENKLGIAVLSKDFNMTNSDLKKALANTQVHMPVSKTTHQSAVMLIVADVIAQALGTNLFIKKSGNSKGFGVLLTKSEQLSFV